MLIFQHLQIGFGARNRFNGKISDVRLYKRALTAGEVRPNRLRGLNHGRQRFLSATGRRGTNRTNGICRWAGSLAQPNAAPARHGAVHWEQQTDKVRPFPKSTSTNRTTPAQSLVAKVE